MKNCWKLRQSVKRFLSNLFDREISVPIFAYFVKGAVAILTHWTDVTKRSFCIITRETKCNSALKIRPTRLNRYLTEKKTVIERAPQKLLKERSRVRQAQKPWWNKIIGNLKSAEVLTLVNLYSVVKIGNENIALILPQDNYLVESTKFWSPPEAFHALSAKISGASMFSAAAWRSISKAFFNPYKCLSQPKYCSAHYAHSNVFN